MLTILKLLLPYAMRFGAQWVANYLQARKERRLAQLEEAAKEAEDVVGKLPGPLAKPVRFLANSPVWLMLSGIVLGSALTLALTRLVGQEKGS